MATSTSSFNPNSLFNVKGLVAVVTGGGTGIGLMLTRALESNGATVYIVGRRLEVLEKAAKENTTVGNIIPLQGDITSKTDLLRIVSTIKSQTGYINLLVNNSGTLGPQYKLLPKATAGSGKSIEELQELLWNNGSAEQFTDVFHVNVTGIWFSTVAFLGLLDAGNKPGNALEGTTSQVVTVSSIAAFRRDKTPFSAAYSASKAAATHLGKILATLLADYDIRSNIIAPGIYPTEMTTGMIPEVVPPVAVPLRRAGHPDDVAGLILYLGSRAAAYTNGTVFLTDGGRLGLFPSTY
ncbi:NAD(P)-binding protein [Sistotremastrum suecicum HHB10207 ss-3]|uniref:NAD(P)-binding protein n=1 Tax=Sistotremastrum suecicum HHB10207 ss-3 TaxID=1314776 RepID=A0A166CBL6_9AGAM|nr:NAD(P)-binding protein [Sistotremastrum suecicum HHB10207 ss-3]